MNENEIELLQMILNSDDPVQAIKKAANIIFDYSAQHGLSDSISSDVLLVSV